MPIRQPTLSGIVFERTSQGGVQPISAARVRADFMVMGDGTGAITWSNAAGQYLLCGIADISQDFAVWATKSGYDEPSLRLDASVARRVDIELTRRP
jgi:hypothetical protein